MYNGRMDPHEKIAFHLQAVQAALQVVDQDALARIVEYLDFIRKKDAAVWIVGNGGSAATASHFACDLRKACLIRAVALPDLTPTVTAYGNDDGWGGMFSHPLHILMHPVDCLVAISCSGRSANVVEASQQIGPTRLIVFTGMPDRFNTLAQLGGERVVYAKSPDIKVQEDVHLAVCHAITACLTGSPHAP